jgi:hypothetical protein
MDTRGTLSVVMLMSFGGCASIVSERDQAIMVVAIADNKNISDVRCVVTNENGTWEVTTPGYVNIKKAHGDLTITCKKDDYRGTTTLESKSDKSVIGSWAMGGLIGYGIDKSTGAGFSYPPNIIVTMNKTEVVKSS